MGNSADYGSELDGAERIIDRSGDIDQRPPDERTGDASANVLVFRPSGAPAPEPQSGVQRYSPASPPPGLLEPSLQLAEIVQRLQKDLDKRYAKAKLQLDALSQKIEAQEKRCLAPKLESDLQQIRFQRQKILIANGPMLADRLREERSRLADLENFKAGNGLVRDAHYPSSPMLAFGVLAILVLLEAGINGVLFADSSDQGLFGGWLEALVLSVTNVGAAFLFGRIVLPQLHRRGFLAKTGAAVLCLAGVLALVAVSLTGAQYRDFKAATAAIEPAGPIAPKHETSGPSAGAKPAPAGRLAKPGTAGAPPPQLQPQAAEKEGAQEREAMARLFATPFSFTSFMSIFLFVIGLCGAAIAALDGYKLDDPFPGYGKRHRRYVDARAQSAAALRNILGQSNAIMTGSFQSIGRKIESFAQEMSALLALHHAYAGDHKALQESLEEAAQDAEAQVARHDRLINKVPSPECRDTYAIGVKLLPPLSGKQIKFYESQDKKLKALQKSAQKEQEDVLGVFEAASADFQKLLAEASQASLHAAAGVLPAGSKEPGV
jgi:hypothetical protein